MSYVLLIKLSAMISMFILTLITSNIPLRSRVFKENQKVMALSSGFSGGLFLSVGLIHLIPEAAEMFDEYFKEKDEADDAQHESESAVDAAEPSEEGEGHEEEHDKEHFPFALFFVVVSFSLVLMIEKVITNHSHGHGEEDNHAHEQHKGIKKGEEEEHHEHQHHHQLENRKEEESKVNSVFSHEKPHHHLKNSNNCPIDNSQNNLNNCLEFPPSTRSNNNNGENGSNISGFQDGSPNQTMLSANFKLNSCDAGENLRLNGQQQYQTHQPGGVELLLLKGEQPGILTGKDNQDIVQEQQQQHQSTQMKNPTQPCASVAVTIAASHCSSPCSVHPIAAHLSDQIDEKPAQVRKEVFFRQLSQQLEKDDSKANLIKAYILQFALGIHATLEGLAVGLQQETGTLLTIALAIVAHKWAEGLVLGVSLKKSGMPLKQATIMSCIQAIMNPIGIAAGWILTSSGNLYKGTLMAVSAGTFLYIATMEVIIEEFSLKRYKYTKFFLYIIGVAFISSLWFVEQLTGGH